MRNRKSKAPFFKLAGIVTSVLFVCFALACSQGTETAPNVGATVDAAVAATVDAQSAALPSEPTQANLGQAIPTQAPETPNPDLLATLLAAGAVTFEAQSTPTLSAHAPIPTPTPTPLATATPIPFNIKTANCHQEDTGGYEFVGSEGPQSYEPWGVREWYRTTWSGEYPNADQIRCLTSLYDSIEDARWSLNFSTALQRGWWSQEGLLEHRQITVVNIGEDSLAFEIETGRGSLPEYVSVNFLIRRGSAVIHLEAVSDIRNVNPRFRGAARRAFFGSVWNPLINLAHNADGRLLAELDRVSR